MDVVIACISRFNPPRRSNCDVNKPAAIVVQVYYVKQIVIRTKTNANRTKIKYTEIYLHLVFQQIRN